MAKATYDIATADFDVSETGMVGFEIIDVLTPRRVPRVQLRVGGALMRAMVEDWDGLAQDALDTGVPSTTLASQSEGFSLDLIPEYSCQPLWPGSNAGTTYDLCVADQSGNGARDSDTLDVVCLDPAYAGGSPGCPTVKAWCEALGGTYTAL